MQHFSNISFNYTIFLFSYHNPLLVELGFSQKYSSAPKSHSAGYASVCSPLSRCILVLFEWDGYQKQCDQTFFLNISSMNDTFKNKLNEIVYKYFWNKNVFPKQKYASPKESSNRYFWNSQPPLQGIGRTLGDPKLSTH